MKYLNNMSIILVILMTTACSGHLTIKKNKEYYFVYSQNAGWLPIENIDPRVFESFPPKKDIKIYGEENRQFVLEKDIKTFHSLLTKEEIKLFCVQLEKKQSALWKWKKEILLLKCHENKLFWHRAKIDKIFFKSLENE
ncbi:MAG: hypothetical protein R3E90_06225 [Marinicella sp.]